MIICCQVYIVYDIYKGPTTSQLTLCYFNKSRAFDEARCLA